mmetsp:Transcript_39928/g.123384  ORF Transcript_39928/g.123384 Transcript_39928/m.123384 type:complete len:259 (+) Transcript_39928:1188-1964(+)
MPVITLCASRRVIAAMTPQKACLLTSGRNGPDGAAAAGELPVLAAPSSLLAASLAASAVTTSPSVLGAAMCAGASSRAALASGSSRSSVSLSSAPAAAVASRAADGPRDASSSCSAAVFMTRVAAASRGGWKSPASSATTSTSAARWTQSSASPTQWLEYGATPAATYDDTVPSSDETSVAMRGVLIESSRARTASRTRTFGRYVCPAISDTRQRSSASRLRCVWASVCSGAAVMLPTPTAHRRPASTFGWSAVQLNF